MTSILQSDRVKISSSWVHCDGSGNIGFLNSAGSFLGYVDTSGQIWTSNYGWLHSYFFNNVINCASTTINTYGSGTNVSPGPTYLLDSGGTLRLGRDITLTNCDCNCACNC